MKKNFTGNRKYFKIIFWKHSCGRFLEKLGNFKMEPSDIMQNRIESEKMFTSYHP